MSKRDGNNLSDWQIRERKTVLYWQRTSRKDGPWALQETCPHCKSVAGEPCMTRVTVNWATQCHADRLTLGRHARMRQTSREI